MYDWENSVFPTVIITFVFATYFTSSVAPDKITCTAQWGYATSLIALVLVGFANFAFETGMVFYNAMLPGLAPESHVGRVSG